MLVTRRNQCTRRSQCHFFTTNLAWTVLASNENFLDKKLTTKNLKARPAQVVATERSFFMPKEVLKSLLSQTFDHRYLHSCVITLTIDDFIIHLSVLCITMGRVTETLLGCHTLLMLRKYPLKIVRSQIFYTNKN